MLSSQTTVARTAITTFAVLVTQHQAAVSVARLQELRINVAQQIGRGKQKPDDRNRYERATLSYARRSYAKAKVFQNLCAYDEENERWNRSRQVLPDAVRIAGIAARQVTT
jgi:hypothetical protein